MAAFTGETSMSESIIVSRPEGQPEQLVLLFHGAGTTAHDLVPLGRIVAREFPAAFVVSVAAPAPSDAAGAREWFSVLDITEENRPARVGAALPAFIATVREWQQQAGVGTDAVALIGFSQGGIMALEATRDQPPIAGRVVSIAGRFAELPKTPNKGTTLHLFHGKLDPVIPCGFTVEAAQHLVKIGADVTADVLPFVGHQINDDIVALLIERLRGHLPKRVWEAALKAAGALEPEDGD
jgi:phospholipase/carboxylesterase